MIELTKREKEIIYYVLSRELDRTPQYPQMTPSLADEYKEIESLREKFKV